MTFDLPRPLRDILPRVSRSFALSLAVLPARLRRPLALAYLLARAADSIADTHLLREPERRDWLDRFAAQLERPDAGAAAIATAVTASDQHPGEQALLRQLPGCFALLAAEPPADQARIRALLRTLLAGMRRDLERFRAGALGTLDSRAALDDYTYHAAGCVGEFWTEMVVAHRSALAHWDRARMAALGRRFGQGLQLTNVLRDLPADLRLGRCYLPREDLARLGLAPGDLLLPERRGGARPLIRELIGVAGSLHAAGWAYVRALPRTEARLRLACAWPLFIGLRTLERLRAAPDLLDPARRIKIPRSAVYRILALSTALVWSDRGLGAYYRRLERRAGTGDGPPRKETS